MVLRIINLGGQPNWFNNYNNFTTVFKIKKISNIDMWGVYPGAIDWNIALHTQI